jgi:hypothetical protein
MPHPCVHAARAQDGRVHRSREFLGQQVGAGRQRRPAEDETLKVAAELFLRTVFNFAKGLHQRLADPAVERRCLLQKSAATDRAVSLRATAFDALALTLLRNFDATRHTEAGLGRATASPSRIASTLGSAINLHQLSDPFLTWNFQIAAASTTRAMAGACREPIRTGRTVARSPWGTRRNCWSAQGSAWCLDVAVGTGRWPLIVRHRSEIGKAATARTIILVFRHSSSPVRRSSADFENGPRAATERGQRILCSLATGA